MSGATPTNGLDADILDMTLEAIQEFADRHLPADLLLRLDHEDECPVELVRKMCGEDLGIQLLFVPEEYGGMGGGSFDVCRVCEKMAAIDLGVATSVLATVAGQRPDRRWAPPRSRRSCGSPASPRRGSCSPTGPPSPRPAATSARSRPPPLPSNRTAASSATASTGASSGSATAGSPTRTPSWPTPPAGPSWFVIERGAEGFTQANPEDKHGIRLSNTAALYLDDVPVDPDALVGGVEGQGLLQAQQVFGYTRLMVAAFGLGAGWSALDRVIAYSTERIQAGGPLSEKQGYTHKLIVPHAARLEAAPGLHRGDGRADRRRRGQPQHRGRDRQVPGHRGRQRRRGGRHPGPRRLRLHPRVHGREDQARRPDHHDLRGHLRDHGDDDRPRPVAGAPEDPGSLLPRPGRRPRRSRGHATPASGPGPPRSPSTRWPRCSSGAAPGA